MSELILQTHNLSKHYGRAKALDNVSLTIEKGQILGLVGRNGAGKTTLIRMVTGQSVPTAGTMTLYGATDRRALNHNRHNIGTMVEIPSFTPDLTARQNLEYYRLQRGIPGKSCVDEVLELVHLADTGKKNFKNFSLGMKQRLGLALVLLNQPEFLLLDEPVNGLDPEGIVQFRELLKQLNRERNTTILISSHLLTELSALATDYAFLEKGELIETISAPDLQSKCRACLEVAVDDASKASLVLEQQLGLRDFEVLSDNKLRIYSRLDQPQRINAALVTSGIALFSSHGQSQNLEDYYLSLIGGDNHV